MSSTNQEGNGGANIRPSARPGIHSHARCPFGVETMGRYGVKTKKGSQPSSPNTADSPSQDAGRDEVDNVMSKFVHTPSPIAVRHGKDGRRNSVDLACQYTEDDSSHDNELAKSLPIYLPSYSSEDIDNWRERTTSPKNIHLSGSTHDTSNHSQSFQDFNESSQYSQRHKSFNNSDTSKKTSGLPIFAILLIGVVALVIGWVFGSREATHGTNNSYDKAMFYHDLNELGKKYSIQEDTLLRIKSGVVTISEKEDTGSFVFTYKSDSGSFNENSFNSFVDAIALLAAKYLRNDSTSAKHLVVDGSQLQMPTYSDLMSEYRDDVARTGVMLLKNLAAVPSNLVMAFHYYCDEFNPLVKKSAIFFTMDMAKCSDLPNKQQSTHANIEKCLSNQWRDVPQDNIGPLLTRVVNIVVDVTNSKL